MDEIKNITAEINKAGGQILLVGGAVIDKILNLPIKDYDFEIYGLNYSQIREILANIGSINEVGKTFGIIKMYFNNLEFDFSIPRKENRIGIGHKEFAVELYLYITVEEAARRRDLTINSMAFDLNTNTLIDPFNGYQDLKNGIIRATDQDTFVEDPLRVLRIMQLLPRKGKIVEPDTVRLCRSMKNEFHYLPKERVYEEFNKLLLKAEKPAIGISFLRECDWIEHFPGLNNLLGYPHNPEHHPEGGVWEHTLMTLNNASRLKDKLPEVWRLAYMYGVLCHDMGKPQVFNKDTFTYHGHDAAGIQIAEEFMRQLTNDADLIDKVIRIVGNHMQTWNLFQGNAKIGSYKRLHNKIRLDVLYYVSLADHYRNDQSYEPKYPASERLLEMFNEIGTETKIPALLTGKFLIKKGLKPGPLFSIILNKAYEAQLEGETNIETLFKIA